MSSIASPRNLMLAAAVAVLMASSVAQAETTLRVPVVSRTIFYLPGCAVVRIAIARFSCSPALP